MNRKHDYQPLESQATLYNYHEGQKWDLIVRGFHGNAKLIKTEVESELKS